MTGEGLPILVDLVNQGVIRILDLVFVAKGQDGSLGIIGLADLDHDGTIDLAVFEGVSSGLVSQEDLADAAPVIAPGSSAAILIFENRWATSVRPGAAPRQGRTRRRRLHPPGRPCGRARRGRRLKGDRPCPSSEVLHEPRPSPARPPPCRTAFSRRQQNRWAQQDEQQYAQQQPQQYAPPAGGACRATEGHGGPAQGSGRPEDPGHPHRRRVRRAEGEDPGVLSAEPACTPRTACDLALASPWLSGCPLVPHLPSDRRKRAQWSRHDALHGVARASCWVRRH